MKFNVSENGHHIGTLEFTEAMTPGEIIGVIVLCIALICVFFIGLWHNLIMTLICALVAFGITIIVRSFANQEKLANIKGIVKFLIGLSIALILYLGVGELFWCLFDDNGGDYWHLYLFFLSITLSVFSVYFMCRPPKSKSSGSNA